MAIPWMDLPNAKYIDCILDDARARSLVWRRLGDFTYNTIRYTLWSEAREASSRAMLDNLRVNIWYASRNLIDYYVDVSVMPFVMDPIAALIAWDDCVYMLEQDPKVVLVTARIGAPPQKYQAALLYGACMAFRYVEKEGRCVDR